MAVLKVQIAPTVIAPLLMATPAVADAATELARCELDAARSFPAPPNKRRSELGRPGSKPAEMRRERRDVHAGGRL